MSEERLVEVETRIAFQEQTIKELSDVIFQQQQELERLAVICADFAKQSKASGSTGPANEKPPHY